MSTSSPLVSIVILNWNGIADTLMCIDSVKRLDYINKEIIVVDNGSRDGSVEKLSHVSGIHLVKLPKNTGFTGGHIEGLRHAKGDYIALLNNDLVVDQKWLTELMSCSVRNNASIVGGRSYQWDETYSPGDETAPFSSYQTVSPISGHTVMLHTGNRETEANNLSGSNLLIERGLLDKIGYFDNSFFAYYEETDLIARAKRAGYRSYYCPSAKVWHKSGASTKNIPYFYYYQMHRNRFRFAFKNYDTPFLRKFLSYYIKEVSGAATRSLKKDNLHDRALVKSFFSNLLIAPSLLYKRGKVQGLGPSYTATILKTSEGFDDVTVLVPCYNYADHVTEALNSIEQQTLLPQEVIIVNDGSTDNSLSVIKEYIASRKDSHIRYTLIDQENKGVIATKNIALEHVHTNWMMYLDADDLIDPDYIYQCIRRARIDNSDIVYTDMEMFGSMSAVHTTAKFNKQLLKSVNFVHNSALMKTSVFKASGGYKEKMSIGFEDWELYITISKLTSKFSYIDEPLLKYRRHDNASRDIAAQTKMPLIVKYLEDLHPDLYNLKFYWWLETYRLKNALKTLLKYPFRLARHTKSHIAKKVKSKDTRASRAVVRLHSQLRNKVRVRSRDND